MTQSKTNSDSNLTSLIAIGGCADQCCSRLATQTFVPCKVSGAVPKGISNRDRCIPDRTGLKDESGAIAQMTDRIALLAAGSYRRGRNIVRPNWIDPPCPYHVLPDRSGSHVVALRQHGVAKTNHLVQDGRVPVISYRRPIALVCSPLCPCAQLFPILSEAGVSVWI